MAAGKTEGRYFTVYFAPQLDARELIKQLNIGLSDRMLAGISDKKQLSAEEELALMLDILYIRVCGILDMNLYSFRTNIKICSNSDQLNNIYRAYFKNEAKEVRSFYSHSLNTIYTSTDYFRREIIGHEIAHAVISNYFVVLPSEKVQEILSGYVTYQLQKEDYSKN